MRKPIYFALLTLLAAGCGNGRTVVLEDRDAGSSRDGGTVIRDGGPNRDGGPGRDGGLAVDGGPTDSGVVTPMKHRPTAIDCDMTRASIPVDPNQSSPNDECAAHTDCTAGMNGRCSGTRFAYVCTYDACFTDADCSTVCLCEGGFGSDHNICLAVGNCSTDADCGVGNFCSPTYSDCGDFTGTVGYYCHTQQDECVDDSDCGVYPWYCSYEQAAGRWTCSDSHCAG